MSDGTFAFKPMLRQSDLEWINQRAKKGDAVQIVGLDGTETPRGYRCATFELGPVLAVAFEPWNPASTAGTIVFLFERSGANWQWREGLDFDGGIDSDNIWQEVMERQDEWEAKQKAK